MWIMASNKEVKLSGFHQEFQRGPGFFKENILVHPLCSPTKHTTDNFAGPHSFLYSML